MRAPHPDPLIVPSQESEALLVRRTRQLAPQEGASRMGASPQTDPSDADLRLGLHSWSMTGWSMPCRTSVYQAPLGAEAHPLTLTPGTRTRKASFSTWGQGKS